MYYFVSPECILLSLKPDIKLRKKKKKNHANPFLTATFRQSGLRLVLKNRIILTLPFA